MKKTFSVEIFPPKIDDGIAAVYFPLAGLAMLKPDFISVTYSANGSKVGLTNEVCDFIKNGYKIESVAHLTCAGSTKDQILSELISLKDSNIKSILALRGDLSGDKKLIDYRYATDLIKDIAEFGNFNIYAACYPEGHTESHSLSKDMDIMLLKYQLGVSHFLSQLFFDNIDFLTMCAKAKAMGINAPISAGIMPITNAKQIVRMVQMSGAKIPTEVAKIISTHENDPDSLRKAGLDYAINQIRNLLTEGVTDIHLYTMNNVSTANTIFDGIKDMIR